MRIRQAGVWSDWGLALVALALALRLLVAPGWMPVSGAAGMTVTLCTAEGPVDLRLPGDHPLQKAHDPCPFGALGAAPLLADAVPPLARPFLSSPHASLHRPAATRPHVAAPAPPPPSTGPPASLA